MLSYVTELSTKSAEVIVAAAFQQHRIKDVSRAQLSGAVKNLCPEKKEKYEVADKSALVMPVAEALLKNRIVIVQGTRNLANLSPSDVQKVGTF